MCDGSAMCLPLSDINTATRLYIFVIAVKFKVTVGVNPRLFSRLAGFQLNLQLAPCCADVDGPLLTMLTAYYPAIPFHLLTYLTSMQTNVCLI